jgi:hypothetical protein
MASFIALLHELGRSQEQRMLTITESDSELHSEINSAIRIALNHAQYLTNNTDDDIGDLGLKLSSWNSSQDDIKRSFDSGIRDLVQEIRSVHHRRNQYSVNLNQVMDSVANRENFQTHATLDEIDEMLNNFTSIVDRP